MERLQKVLAQAGIASRRKCEEWIVAGRVAVDGDIITELGHKVDASKQRITVDGEDIEQEQKICIILNKPTSRITSVTDPEGRKTVMDLLGDVKQRIYPIGRLDYDTSGLLLLTNDGDLTQRLLHPSFHMGKVYRVTVVGEIDKEAVRKLQEGILLDDGKTSPAEVSVLRRHPRESVVELTIFEGRNRQVRRMFETLNLPVKRLKRIQFGPLQLGNLSTGAWRYLTRQEWEALYQTVDMSAPAYEAAALLNTSKLEHEKNIIKKTDKSMLKPSRHGHRLSSRSGRSQQKSHDSFQRIDRGVDHPEREGKATNRRNQSSSPSQARRSARHGGKR